uniref:Uncharacterized protein n=1 Tax=Mastacembelus armatus TaxID=205130 RepID=A0A3Q3L412_9TELE
MYTPLWYFSLWHYCYISITALWAHVWYSIVIGFWVGLAVFVIFMFFLLTLLTKTGAPHFEQPCEKQPCLTGYMDASFNNGALPCQSLPFQCYISKEGQVSSRKLWTSVGSEGRGALGGSNATQKEDILLAHFSIPNCVNSEQSSSSGEDSLLLSKQELPVFLERRDQSSSNRNDDIDFT